MNRDHSGRGDAQCYNMPWFLKQEKAVKDAMITLARQKVHRIKEEYNEGEEERKLQSKDKGGRRGEREKEETETRRER